MQTQHARLVHARDAHLRWDEAGQIEGFGVPKFLVAICAVAQAYATWCPLGRASLSLDAAGWAADSADYQTTEGDRAAVTRGIADIARMVPRPRGAALAEASPFLHACLSEGHKGAQQLPGLHVVLPENVAGPA